VYAPESRIVAKIMNEMRWGDGGRHTACGKVPVVKGETGYGGFVGEREPDMDEQGGSKWVSRR